MSSPAMFKGKGHQFRGRRFIDVNTTASKNELTSTYKKLADFRIYFFRVLTRLYLEDFLRSSCHISNIPIPSRDTYQTLTGRE